MFTGTNELKKDCRTRIVEQTFGTRIMEQGLWNKDCGTRIVEKGLWNKDCETRIVERGS